MNTQSATHQLTITVAGGKLSVDDGSGGGGDLKVRDGDVIQWSNQSGWKCRLRFKKLKLGQNPGYDGDRWPFQVGNGPWFEVDDGSTWSGTIDAAKATNGKKVAYIKYDVKASGSGAPDDLDPMIIVDN